MFLISLPFNHLPWLKFKVAALAWETFGPEQKLSLTSSSCFIFFTHTIKGTKNPPYLHNIPTHYSSLSKTGMQIISYLFQEFTSCLHTITYKSRLTQKKLYKKTNAIFRCMGKTGLSHYIFSEFSLRPFEVVEVEWKSASKFWGCDLEILKIIK